MSGDVVRGSAASPRGRSCPAWRSPSRSTCGLQLRGELDGFVAVARFADDRDAPGRPRGCGGSRAAPGVIVGEQHRDLSVRESVIFTDPRTLARSA